MNELEKPNNSIKAIAYEILTPVHVGSGNELFGNSDYIYFQNSGKIAVVDESKLLSNLHHNEEKAVDIWMDAIQTKGNLYKILKGFNPKIEAKDVQLRAIELYKGNTPNIYSKIREQIQTAGKPYLPGSSIKGAIRTAILTQLIEQNPNFVKNPENLRNYKRFYDDSKVQQYYLHMDRSSSSHNEDWLRFLHIGDVVFSTSVLIEPSENQFLQYNKPNKLDWMECIPSKAKSTGRITITEKLLEETLKQQPADRKSPPAFLNIENLIALINKHTIQLIQQEIAYWQKKDSPESMDEYLESMKDMLDEAQHCKAGKECVLRIGANIGWASITGGWAVTVAKVTEKPWRSRTRNASEFDLPKTRKMTPDGTPFGFVKLTLQQP